jgi:hypothetical protein
MTSKKNGVKKKDTHFSIPIQRNFLRALEIFYEEKKTTIVILSIVNRLFHVNFFFQIPMQEGGFNTHLMDLQFI